MCPRQSTTFIKRQKERARQEKQREKAQRKLQRKAEKLAAASLDPGASTQPDIAPQPPEQQLEEEKDSL